MTKPGAEAYGSCSVEGCENRFADHMWGKIKLKGWFIMKDGTAYCPDHIPEWVEEWRAKQRARSMG